MNKKIFFVVCVVPLFVGCASNKLTMPSGDWQPVNQVDFIPDGVDKYVENNGTLEILKEDK